MAGCPVRTRTRGLLHAGSLVVLLLLMMEVFCVVTGCTQACGQARLRQAETEGEDVRPTWEEWVALKMQVLAGVRRGSAKYDYSIVIVPTSERNTVCVRLRYGTVPRGSEERAAMRDAISEDVSRLHRALCAESMYEMQRRSGFRPDARRVEWRWEILGSGLDDDGFPPPCVLGSATASLASSPLTNGAAGKDPEPRGK